MAPALVLAAVILAGLSPARDAEALRLMTYNLLNYSGGRTEEFRAITDATAADVIVVQEILSQGAVDVFRSDVLEVVAPGEWVAGDFVNGPDTDNAIFYRPAAVTYVGHHVIATTLRDIDEWTLRPATHASPDANFRVYVVHLKASTGSTNEQRRLTEVTAMRDRMETFPAGQCYVVAGDFNIYTASEPAYQYMTDAGSGAAGVVQDPIDREGNWHINASFADIHTQSPRVVSFGGGATGGLDDRFDMLLVAPALQDGDGLDVLSETYNAFGQDGLHFDGPLNVPPYVVVDSLMAARLHDASDHLPVHTDLQIPALLVADQALDLGTVITGGTSAAVLVIDNAAPPPADALDYALAAPPGFEAPPGPFTLPAGDPPAAHPVTLATTAVGPASGDLVVTSDDPDHPSAPVALTALVLDHAQPSVDGGTVVLAGDLDLGVVATGDSIEATARVWNVDAGPLRARLEVYDATLTGDPRFFLADGTLPLLIDVTPGSWTVAFDAAAAPEGDYTGLLTFDTRDEPGLPGAVDLASLTYALSVSVSGGTATVALETGAPARGGLLAVAPNPFRPTTWLEVGMREPGRIDLRIHDVQGRAVRVLRTGTLAPGVHRLAWDGRDAGGREVAPGIYFVRLTSPAGVETTKLVRLR
ncbi:MAG: choice-of-anchor D domain-containing protein [Candidatus Eiseniibacteriota bacterium]